MTLSLKDEILEKLHLKKGGQKTASSNISKATKDFAKSDAPQFRGKSQKKRHQMAVAAGLSAARGENANPKIGDKMIYEGKQVVVQSINEITGMAIVKLPKFRDPKIVRTSDLAPQQLTEGILGIAAIAPTYREETTSKFMKFDLDPEDIGLLWEDTQEEPDDNGSNVRHDGHTGRTEVDELPTPSDTIAPAYSDEKPPKEMGTPLSIEPGYTVATDPDFDGYDYPADAPDIPRPDFEGDENGNPRSPHWSGDHNAGEGLENREDDDSERTDETFDHEYPIWQEPVSDDWRRQQERRRKRGLDTGGPHHTQKDKMRVGRHGDSKKRPNTQFENRRRNAFSFVNEDGGMADRYMDFMDKGGTDMDFDAHGGNVTPGQIPSPQGMGTDMAHDAQYGNFNSARSGTGPTQIPPTPTPTPPTPMPPTPSAPTPPTPNLQAGGAIPNTTGMNQASAAPLPQVPHYGPNLESRAIASYRKLLAEMGDMLNGDEHEPKSGDTITVTLPAMASIVCTVAHKMQGDQNLMKSMIEALAEVGHGKTIDMPDLEDVAAHMNGEETQEIENREEGHPEHQGIEISSGNGGIEVSMPSDKWPGDGEKSGTGKTKLMGGLGESEEEEVEECDDEMKECDDEEMAESDDNFYGWDDIVAETYKPTYEEELRMIKRRAGLKFWN